MATTQQEVIDVQYDIKLAEQQHQLREIFSDTIIGWGNTINLATFDDFSSYNGVVDLIDIDLDINSIKGVTYLSNCYLLQISMNNLSGESLNLSSLTNLINLYAYENGLLSVGNLSRFVNLKILRVYKNQLSSLGRLDKLVLLEELNAYDNLLSDIGDLSGMIALKALRLDTNSFTTAKVDKILSDMVTVASYQNANGGVVLSEIRLEGGTNGVPSAAGLVSVNTLVNTYGIPVTVNS